MPTPYNFAYACFDCRKSFKRALDNVDPKDYPKTMVCPDCGGDAVCLGRHFKPPKRSDHKQWAKVSFLWENGFRFQKIRPNPNSIESIPYPQTLEDAKSFVLDYADYARFDI